MYTYPLLEATASAEEDCGAELEVKVVPAEDFEAGPNESEVAPDVEFGATPTKVDTFRHFN